MTAKKQQVTAKKSTKTMGSLKLLTAYFREPGQTLSQVAGEVKTLSLEERTDLASELRAAGFNG